jgi:hypothetical protein
MRDLLAKHEEPDPTRDVPAHRYWARQAARMFRLAMFVLLVNIVWGTRVDACSITQKKGEAPVVTDCAKRLTPAEAAEIVRPNSYVAPFVCTDCDGPRITIAPYSGERWQQDFLRTAEFEAKMKRLKNWGDYVPNGIPLFPYPYVVPPPTHRRK